MKSILLFCVVLALTSIQPAFGQNLTDDPLAESQIIRRVGDELIGIVPKYEDGAYSLSVEVYKYFKAMEFNPDASILRVLDYSGPPVADRYFNRYDITTSVNADRLSDIFAAWMIDGAIDIVALRANPEKLASPQGLDGTNQPSAEWEKITHFSKSDPVPFDGPIWLTTAPRLTSGDLTGDGSEEIILAYLAIDSDEISINLSLLDVSDSLEITELASAMDQPVLLDQPEALQGDKWDRPLNIFELTAGDFNGDGVDEIILVGRQSSGSGWELFASVYSYSKGNAQLVQNNHGIFHTMPDSIPDLLFEVSDVSVWNGRFVEGAPEQAVVGFTHYYKTPNYYTVFPYLAALSFDESLSQMTLSEKLARYNPDDSVIDDRNYYVNSLRISDINADGLEEILSIAGAFGKSKRIYQLNADLQFNEYANLDTIPGISSVYALGNIIIDTVGAQTIPELATNGGNQLYSFDIDADGSLRNATLASEGDRLGFSDYGCWFPGLDVPYDCSAPLLTAGLIGDIRLGVPKRSSITKILQPMVILNAPPIHFDVIDGDIYDLNRMYGDSQGSFKSSYRINTTEKTEVQTEFNKDWGISGSLSAGGKLYGFSVKAHLTGTYGEKFSEKGESSTTVKVNISVDAIEDDRIYATVIDYNVWEYPVYFNGIEQGHVLVVEPEVTENRWFPSKSWSGNSYVPDHEVGNILSYREYATLSENPAVDLNGFIKGDHNTSFVLDGNSSYAWSLEFEDFQAEGVETVKEKSMDWGASIGYMGVEASISGHYSSDEIKTQRTSVSKGLYLGVELDALNTGLGEVSYRVTPYAYWAKNGALVIDYAVQPEMAEPGFTPTWWQNNYGNNADPGFILPWRYDPEKGFSLTDPVKRLQTKDITFFPDDPVEGDLVTITTRINNFSLLPTLLPVGISFYEGDPDEGGTLIRGEGGETVVYTDTAIPARGRKIVQMDWIVPDGIGSFPRIYGLINPEHQTNEIHNNNNKGWNVLGKELVVSLEDDYNNIPSVITLRQNYPNPFNPSTTFEYSVPVPGMVDLSVYTILGQKVTTVFSGYLNTGIYTQTWDAGGLASGVYLYRLTTGEYSQTRKLLLLK